ncbi:hypothetical protein [Dyadobacter bucti]|uniref:hypothetical protein n=1 Tax=Dyadobacter bucti TaxID=2572203 RepID=UPI003F6EB6EE
MTELSRTYNIPVRTLRDWKKKFINLGLPGLDHIKRERPGKAKVYVTANARADRRIRFTQTQTEDYGYYQKIVLLAEHADKILSEVIASR